jgi:hypothetical protein
MAELGVVPERLAGAAAVWAQVAAGFVPSLPVRPDVAASYEAHVLSTICVELVQPLTGFAARWTDGGSTSVLGRVEVKLRHLEATGKKMGRDLGLGPAIAQTRDLLGELKVTSTAPRPPGPPLAVDRVAPGRRRVDPERRIDRVPVPGRSRCPRLLVDEGRDVFAGHHPAALAAPRPTQPGQGRRGRHPRAVGTAASGARRHLGERPVRGPDRALRAIPRRSRLTSLVRVAVVGVIAPRCGARRPGGKGSPACPTERLSVGN